MVHFQSIPKFAATLLALLGMACAQNLPSCCQSLAPIKADDDFTAIAQKTILVCQRTSSCCCHAKMAATACACSTESEQSAPEPLTSEESGRMLEWVPCLAASLPVETLDGGQCCRTDGNHFSMPHQRSIQSLFCIWHI